MDLDAFLAVADSLLAVPSTADRPAELHRALDLMLDVVGAGSAGFEVERFTSGGRPSALCWPAGRWPRRPTFEVIFNAHLDVVPGSPEQFRPRRVGDRLYARGAQDMK